MPACFGNGCLSRQALTLCTEVAKYRIHEGLAAELLRGATENIDRLRRVLVTTRDSLTRQRAAEQICGAEAEVRKWRAAHADYRRRRDYFEYALRDAVRVLA
jgi:hypothetical protein